MKKHLTNEHFKVAKNPIPEAILYFASILLFSMEAHAFDLDGGIKAIADPVKNGINSYYAVFIFIVGVGGALLQAQGDLRERAVGFIKGSLWGGLGVAGVKAGLGI